MDKSKIRRIAIFDFDGTIAFSPTPEIGKKIWLDKTGEKFPADGWWGRLESLDPKVFDVELNKKVVSAIIEDTSDDECYTVLLTGRIKKFEKTVRSLLESKEVPNMDDYKFADGRRTLDFKLDIIEKLKNEFPNLTHFDMWEDRRDHIPKFIKWGKLNFKDNFRMFIVD